ncbi:unnamed protein product [Nesidiocoris tenuis]|uniref:Uncharacterized protein n=1 Tax=Nesidiocoris tenuis TaxID=355587 RepID=A0A6H5GNJ2_9HEMI|nr:unnamed protein product [Nesidiocoris tenuis]
MDEDEVLLSKGDSSFSQSVEASRNAETFEMLFSLHEKTREKVGLRSFTSLNKVHHCIRMKTGLDTVLTWSSRWSWKWSSRLDHMRWQTLSASGPSLIFLRNVTPSTDILVPSALSFISVTQIGARDDMKRDCSSIRRLRVNPITKINHRTLGLLTERKQWGLRSIVNTSSLCISTSVFLLQHSLLNRLILDGGGQVLVENEIRSRSAPGNLRGRTQCHGLTKPPYRIFAGSCSCPNYMVLEQCQAYLHNDTSTFPATAANRPHVPPPKRLFADSRHLYHRPPHRAHIVQVRDKQTTIGPSLCLYRSDCYTSCFYVYRLIAASCQPKSAIKKKCPSAVRSNAHGRFRPISNETSAQSLLSSVEDPSKMSSRRVFTLIMYCISTVSKSDERMGPVRSDQSWAVPDQSEAYVPPEEEPRNPSFATPLRDGADEANVCRMRN